MMQPGQKPSHRELFKKLRLALEAIDAGRFGPVEGDLTRHVLPDMAKLGLDDINDYWDLVYECIQLAQNDPMGCYRQPNPRKSTQHSSIKNDFLWAFVVHHSRTRLKLYFKFCLKEQKEGLYYVHIDCHESNPRH